MHIMASRTFLVNPDDNQKQAYIIINEALDIAIRALVPGKPVKNAYIAAKDHINSKDPALAGKVFNHFGFSVSIIIID
jgi:Xaa-Pro aminopeptidase